MCRGVISFDMLTGVKDLTILMRYIGWHRVNGNPRLRLPKNLEKFRLITVRGNWNDISHVLDTLIRGFELKAPGL